MKRLEVVSIKITKLGEKKFEYPEVLQSSNISSFYKKKGDHFHLDLDRSVFNVVKVRSILDKLIYNDMIDQNMSCSNIGGKKKQKTFVIIYLLSMSSMMSPRTKKM